MTDLQAEKHRAGFTLVEVVTAAGLGAVLLGGALSFLLAVDRHWGVRVVEVDGQRWPVAPAWHLVPNLQIIHDALGRLTARATAVYVFGGLSDLANERASFPRVLEHLPSLAWSDPTALPADPAALLAAHESELGPPLRRWDPRSATVLLVTPAGDGSSRQRIEALLQVRVSSLRAADEIWEAWELSFLVERGRAIQVRFLRDPRQGRGWDGAHHLWAGPPGGLGPAERLVWLCLPDPAWTPAPGASSPSETSAAPTGRFALYLPGGVAR